MKKYQRWILPLCFMLFFIMATTIHADVGNTFSGGDIDFGSGKGSFDLGLIFFFLDNPIIFIVAIIALVLYSYFTKGSDKTKVHDTGFKSNDGLNETQVATQVRQNDPLFEVEAFKS